MTIKQQGGIFGRNPTFRSIETDGGDVLFNDTDSNSPFLWDADEETLFIGPQSGAAKNGNTMIRLQNGNNAYMELVSTTSTTAGILMGDTDDSFRGGMLYDNGDDELRLWSGNAARVVIDSSGNVALNNGAGIDFSATSGTGTSELFDDYEEGTWTPILAFGGGSVGITYAVQEGAYTKIGRQVTLTGRLLFTNIGSSTGAVTVTGLPFNAGTNYPASLIDANTGFTGLTAPTFFVLSSGTLYMSTQGAADRQNVTNASFTNGADMRFLVTYFV